MVERAVAETRRVTERPDQSEVVFFFVWSKFQVLDRGENNE